MSNLLITFIPDGMGIFFKKLGNSNLYITFVKILTLKEHVCPISFRDKNIICWPYFIQNTTITLKSPSYDKSLERISFMISIEIPFKFRIKKFSMN